MQPKVIDWDGASLPAQLRDLPPGRYVVEPVDSPAPLTLEEEQGIIAALNQIDAGQGMPLAKVVNELLRHPAKK